MEDDKLIESYNLRQISIKYSIAGQMLRDKKEKNKNSTKNIELKLKNSNENFEQLIEKQLKDDFQVHEYLNRNQVQGFNADEYVSLFNKLLAEKMKKKKKKDFLQCSTKLAFLKVKSFYNHSESKLKRPSSISLWRENQKMEDGDIYYTEEEYLKIKQQSQAEHQIIQMKIKGELELQRILWKEIMDNKKSLNLMKGDIGHLIARNQSIKTLESKMNKVSLVASDQLKRVKLALSKDKDEIRLRHEMQRNFHVKLRGMENMESSNVKRLKLNYIESMKRKKEVFEKLNLIEKQCASIEEYSDKKRLKNIKNTRSLLVLQLLRKLCELIDTIPQLNQKFQKKQMNIKSYSSQLKMLADNVMGEKEEKSKKYSKNKVDLFNDDSLSEFEERIVIEYKTLQNEVEDQSNISNELIKRLEELWSFLNSREDIRQKIFQQMNEDERSQLIIPFSYKDYITKLKDFSHNLKPIYLLLQFFSNKVVDSTVTQYVSVLDENYQKFMKFTDYEPQTLLIEERIFHHLLEDLRESFVVIKEKIQNHEYNHIEQNRNSRKMQESSQTDNSYISHLESQAQFADGDQIYDKKKVVDKIEKKNFHDKKNEEQCAKRIQLLEKIDLNYYKMIKSTLEMEKDNTRKNYEFMKTFKRTKYSTQDELLEEKRFEASFSSLFSQQKVSRSNYTPKQSGYTASTFKPEKKTSIKRTYYHEKKKTDSSLVLTTPIQKKEKKKMLSKTGLTKKTRISSKVREILQEI